MTTMKMQNDDDNDERKSDGGEKKKEEGRKKRTRRKRRGRQKEDQDRTYVDSERKGRKSKDRDAEVKTDTTLMLLPKTLWRSPHHRSPVHVSAKTSIDRHHFSGRAWSGAPRRSCFSFVLMLSAVLEPLTQLSNVFRCPANATTHEADVSTRQDNLKFLEQSPSSSS